MGEITIKTRMFAEGGDLKHSTHWEPNIGKAGDDNYVVRSSNDYLLHKFCGQSLRHSDFLAVLRARRNDAIDALILHKMNEDDPLSTLTRLRKWRPTDTCSERVAPTLIVSSLSW